MATLAQIHDFEGAVELAVRAALDADQGISAHISRQQGLLPHQFVGARLLMGQPFDVYHQFADGRLVERQFSATLNFYIRTLRESEDAMFPTELHADLRSSIRVFMLDGISKINAELTLHEIASQTMPQGSNIEYSNDRYDITELPYQISLGIRDDAWPA